MSKRKEFTPKKKDAEQSNKIHKAGRKTLFSKKEVDVVVLDLSSDDEDLKMETVEIASRSFNNSVETESSCITINDSDEETGQRRKFKKETSIKTETSAVKEEMFNSIHDEMSNSSHDETDDDSDSSDGEENKVYNYYKDDLQLPIYGEHNPELKEIFQICSGRIKETAVCSKRPFRIKNTATFIVNQALSKVSHPFDFDSDDTGLKYNKKENTRFYQVVNFVEGRQIISHEVTPIKNNLGKVIGGTYRDRDRRGWETVEANVEQLYAVIRRRANFTDDSMSFTRVITFIMGVKEYNKSKLLMKNTGKYKLQHSNIILHYSIEGEFNCGNQNKKYRTTQHSTKETIKEKVKEDSGLKPRIIQDSFEMQTSIVDRETDSTVPLNLKQVQNFKANYGRSNKCDDEIAEIMHFMLNQPKGKVEDPTNADQSFLQEILFRNGKQPSYILYTEQSLKDMERFCTNEASPVSFRSVLAVDTTFNIAGHYFTQTTYRNLSLLRNDNLKSPWFPGPILVHRHQEKKDFSYMWQAIKRGNKILQDLALIGTDECDELFGGILDETQGNTGHFLGKEHVFQNIKKKLECLNFPAKQTKWILNDIFGDPLNKIYSNSKITINLIDSKTEEEFDANYACMKERWSKLEKQYTVRSGNEFLNYFEKHKLAFIKEKMSAAARMKHHMQTEHGQNPIEWLNFLAKSEIDTEKNIKDSHKTTGLITCFKKLKDRSLRLYRDATKAVYGSGPYSVSPVFSHLNLTYDEFQELSRIEKNNLIKRFYSYIPSEKVLRNNGYIQEENTMEDTEKNKEDDKEENGNTKSSTTTNTNEDSNETRISFTVETHDLTDKPKEVNRHKKLPFLPEDFKLTAEYGIPKSLAEATFQDAIELLNENGAVTKGASSDEYLRTVKSNMCPIPYIVHPAEKNRHYLICKCNTFNMLDFCHHALAASADIGITFQYLSEVVKKLQLRKKKNKPAYNITKAFESTLTLSQQGKKKNEITKQAARKKQREKNNIVTTSTSSTPSSNRKTEVAVSSASTSSSNREYIQREYFQSFPNQQFHMQSTQPTYSQANPTNLYSTLQQTNQCEIASSPYQQFHMQSTQPTYNQANPTNLYSTSQQSNQWETASSPYQQFQMQSTQPTYNQANPTNLYSTSQQTKQWETSSSPYEYEVVVLPDNVKKCYGCSQQFANKYRVSPYNLVIRHKDKRIQGLSETGTLLYGHDFQNTYYHLNANHILKKNSTFRFVRLNNSVEKMLSTGQMQHLYSCGLTIVKEQ